jgi:hypothetical protein
VYEKMKQPALRKILSSLNNTKYKDIPRKRLSYIGKKYYELEIDHKQRNDKIPEPNFKKRERTKFEQKNSKMEEILKEIKYKDVV